MTRSTLRAATGTAVATTIFSFSTIFSTGFSTTWVWTTLTSSFCVTICVTTFSTTCGAGAAQAESTMLRITMIPNATDHFLTDISPPIEKMDRLPVILNWP